MLRRVDEISEQRNRVVHDYWQPWHSLDPDMPDADGRSQRRTPWLRMDVRSPLGTVRATASDLADADVCLWGLLTRRADADDLLVLLWHHTDIMRGRPPTASVDDLLARITARAWPGEVS